jgi:putative Holliday junction resolvase
VQSPQRPYSVLGLDFGLRRIGIASANTLSRQPQPLTAVRNGPAGPDWPALKRLIELHAPAVLVLGTPYNVDGTVGTLGKAADGFAADLAARFRLPLVRVDERYSSIEATALLTEQRRSGARARRVAHADIDCMAAAIILQRWLNGEEGEMRA